MNRTYETIFTAIVCLALGITLGYVLTIGAVTSDCRTLSAFYTAGKIYDCKPREKGGEAS